MTSAFFYSSGGTGFHAILRKRDATIIALNFGPTMRMRSVCQRIDDLCDRQPGERDFVKYTDNLASDEATQLEAVWYATLCPVPS